MIVEQVQAVSSRLARDDNTQYVAVICNFGFFGRDILRFRHGCNLAPGQQLLVGLEFICIRGAAGQDKYKDQGGCIKFAQRLLPRTSCHYKADNVGDTLLSNQFFDYSKTS